MEQRFETRLIARGPKGAWTVLTVPFDVATVFGTRARVPVAGTLNGTPFRNALLPEGDGTHLMMVGKELRSAAGVAPGDVVTVVLDVDRTERVAIPPAELDEALAGDAAARAAFETLAPSHRREFCDWVGGAKKAETRAARAAKSLAMIKERRHTR